MKTTHHIIIKGSLLFLIINLFGQIGINTKTLNSNTILDIRTTTVQKTLILPYATNSNLPPTPVPSMITYNTDQKCVQAYDEILTSWPCLNTPIANRINLRAEVTGTDVDLNNLNTGNYVIIPFKVITYGSTVNYNTNTAIFTAPKNGYYFITSKFESGDFLNNNALVEIAILKNGNVISSRSYSNNNNATVKNSRQIFTTVLLASEDQISIGIKSNLSTFKVDAWEGNTNVSITLLE